MLSSDRKIEIAERIISSNTFKNAPTSIAILRYLVQANIENRSLKESIIDIEFFGGNTELEKSNPRVRVNIYNLRKKLDTYYENEGINETNRLVIDKGQYDIRFEEKKIAQKVRRIKDNNRIIPYALLLVMAIFLLIWGLPNTKPMLWKGFFSNNHSTYLFVGDAFGYAGNTVSGQKGWTRDFDINSLDEYYEMLDKKPELKAVTNPSGFNYSTCMAENATHDLSRFFTKWQKDFEIKYATQASFEDIKKGNIIYVGRLKDQKDFTFLFNEANTYFQIENNQLRFVPINSFDTESEYALVSRIPGPNNTEQFLFFSNHDIGVMATVEYFTNSDSISSFSERHLNKSPYFTALYKAKGKERVNLSLEEILVVPF